MKDDRSIFQQYFEMPEKLSDRLVERKETGVDVIIPIMNTNELWERNLHSIYKEIPVNRLLIGDSGSTDVSVECARKFPRVEVIDQSKLKTLGGSLKDLLARIKTDWFVYLHSDVFLPPGWYDEMVKLKDRYDWFECPQKLTAMIEFWYNRGEDIPRPYSGSQMGKRSAFEKVLPLIDDDYLYRNEDMVIMELVNRFGGKYGKTAKTFHYHQLMNKRGEREPKFESFSLKRELDKQWEIKTCDMQARGIIKYTDPKPYLLGSVNESLYVLHTLGALNWLEFKRWVKETNPAWLKHIDYRKDFKHKAVGYIRQKAAGALRRIKRLVSK